MWACEGCTILYGYGISTEMGGRGRGEREGGGGDKGEREEERKGQLPTISKLTSHS